MQGVLEKKPDSKKDRYFGTEKVFRVTRNYRMRLTNDFLPNYNADDIFVNAFNCLVVNDANIVRLSVYDNIWEKGIY